MLGAVRAIARLAGGAPGGGRALLERLPAAVAEVCGASRAAFFLLDGDVLTLQEDALGMAPEALGRLATIPPGEQRRLLEGTLRGEKRRAAAPPDTEGWASALVARDWMSAPWPSGDHVLGLVAVFDSADPAGFTSEDEMVLEAAATMAGLLWVRAEVARGDEPGPPSDPPGPGRDRGPELEEMKRRILNLAAHELRGPIAVVRGYLSMLAEGSLDEQGLRRILPILTAKAAQIDGLVTQMLEVARMDEGRLELRAEVADLAAITREAVDFAAQLSPPGLSVFMEGPREAISDEGDRERQATIVGNLVDNAMKYSPGGGTVRCRVGVQEARTFVSVTDEGLGIAAEDLPLLFTRFGRIVTPENSHIPGTGLGLHLSRELARMHGGDITVASDPGRGSTFTLWLPLHR